MVILDQAWACRCLPSSLFHAGSPLLPLDFLNAGGQSMRNTLLGFGVFICLRVNLKSVCSLSFGNAEGMVFVWYYSCFYCSLFSVAIILATPSTNLERFLIVSFKWPYQPSRFHWALLLVVFTKNMLTAFCFPDIKLWANIEKIKIKFWIQLNNNNNKNIENVPKLHAPPPIDSNSALSQETCFTLPTPCFLKITIPATKTQW